MNKLLTLASALLAAIALAGCASSPFAGGGMALGTPRQQVIERMGQPTRIVRLADGTERLQYSQQPVGRFAWMVDIDTAGKVMSTRQALTIDNFNRIEPGTWTRNDVEREFGPPAQVESVASWNGPILTYRWLDNQRSDMFYWVYLDGQNVVRRAHPGMEFVNAPNDRP